MRKYYQACLAIIATVSLISLLFYRHEYNKLRYVLEVFNYFGEPHAKILPSGTESLPKKSSLYLSEPLPSWQRLNNDLYVYSTYNIDRQKVRSIAFGRIDENLKCEVFFEEEPLPISGAFSYTKIAMSSEFQDLEYEKYQGYYLNCDYAVAVQRPIAVRYYKKYENHKDIHMFSIKNVPQDLKGEDSAMCVAPPLEKPLTRADLISFLSIHNFTGFQHFVVYDYGLPNAINVALKSAPLSQFNYETVPWNFPFTNIDTDVIKNVIEADCLHRTVNRVMYAVTVSWNEYIVLKKYVTFSTIGNLINKLEESGIIGNCYTLTPVTFCTQEKYKHATDSLSVIFRKNYVHPNMFGRHSIAVCKPHKVHYSKDLGKKTVSKKFVVVNRYLYCHAVFNADLDTNTSEDSTLEFLKIVNNSLIFKTLSSKTTLIDY